MKVFRVSTAGMYLFERPNEISAILPDSDVELNTIVLGYKRALVGTCLYDNKYATEYNWWLVRTPRGKVGWIAEGSKPARHRPGEGEQYIKEL